MPPENGTNAAAGHGSRSDVNQQGSYINYNFCDSGELILTRSTLVHNLKMLCENCEFYFPNVML